MLKIKDYAAQINTLHAEGKCAQEISKIIGIKYHQPVYNYFKKMGWTTLSREEYRRNTTYKVDKNFFVDINTEEKAYILGFLCADGHIDTKNPRITITLSDKDYRLLEIIRDAMHSTHPIKRGIEHSNPYKKSKNKVLYQCFISINGKELIEPLVKMGISGKKTYSLDSSIMDYVPEHLTRHFLRGYFDGDGCISWDKRYKSGNKSTVHIAGNYDFLQGSFNKYFPTNCNLRLYKKSAQCYDYTIQDKHEVLRFLAYLYNDAKIYLERKYNLYRYAMWSFKTELIAGNSYFIELMKGQSAANPLVKCLRQVQRLADETITNPFEEEAIEYNSATNAQQQNPQANSVEDIVRTT
jgi:hypothetical protein